MASSKRQAESTAIHLSPDPILELTYFCFLSESINHSIFNFPINNHRWMLG